MSGLLVKSTVIMRENLEELNARGLADSCRCCSAAPRSRATTSSATCARSTTAACSTARTRSRACARWTRSWPASAPATLDPAFGREAGGRQLPPRKSELDAAAPPVDIPAPFRRRDRRPPLHAAVRRFARREGHLDRRHRRRTSTRPRCSATSGSSVREKAAARTTRSSRRASGRRCATSSTIAKQESLLVPAVAWGYFAVNAEGNDLVVWKDDTRTQEWMRFAFPRQRKDAVPLHRRLLPPRRVGRARLRRVPRGDDGHARVASASRSCSPPTGTRSTCCCTACRSR